MTAWPHGAPRVGERASMTRTIEAEDIVRFTAMSGDRNPVHYDADAAPRAPASVGSWSRAASPPRSSTPSWPNGCPARARSSSRRTGSSSPPPGPGDTITGEVEVTSVRDDKPITTLVTRVVRGDGEVVIDGTAVCWTFDVR